MSLPSKVRALILRKKNSDPVYYDAVLEEILLPKLEPGYIMVKMTAAAFNHRELWQLKGLYPGIVDGSTFGGDGAGIVIAGADSEDPLIGQRVFLTPVRGWEKHPLAPESTFGVPGGGALPPFGTLQEYVVVERDQVVPTPSFLSDEQAAAWPLGGLTAWRAAMVNGEVQKGQNVLITGVGGGVALFALQFCVAIGANVYVTSGGTDKIEKAIALGAKGGVNYKDQNWPAQLGQLLQKHGQKHLDVVIDSAGGPIMQQTGATLRAGGRVVCYGMTADPKITVTMYEVLQSKKLFGSTLGSHEDLLNATRFLEEHRIIPVVSHILHGLEHASEGFDLMKNHSQFGKIVVKMSDSV